MIGRKRKQQNNVDQEQEKLDSSNGTENLQPKVMAKIPSSMPSLIKKGGLVVAVLAFIGVAGFVAYKFVGKSVSGINIPFLSKGGGTSPPGGIDLASSFQPKRQQGQTQAQPRQPQPLQQPPGGGSAPFSGATTTTTTPPPPPLQQQQQQQVYGGIEQPVVSGAATQPRPEPIVQPRPESSSVIQPATQTKPESDVSSQTSPPPPAQMTARQFRDDQRELLERLRKEQLNIIQSLQEQLKELSVRVLASSNQVTNVLSQYVSRGQTSAESWMSMEETKKALDLYKNFVDTEKAIVGSRLSIVADIVKVIKEVNDVFNGGVSERRVATMIGEGPSGEDSLMETLRRINEMRASGGVRTSPPVGASSAPGGAKPQPSVDQSSSSAYPSLLKPVFKIALMDGTSVTMSDGATLKVGESYNGYTLKSVNPKNGTAKFCSGKKCITAK
ncbi:MAG: hypothetical protein QXO76_00265 [Thermoproteota archaeon]